MSFESFEEFQAVQQRWRNRSIPAQPATSSPQLREKTADDDAKARGSGAFVERHEVQSPIVALLVLDSYLSFSYVILQSHSAASRFTLLIPTLLRVMDAFSIFCSGVFVFEIFIMLISFRLRFFFHFGCLLDTFIISLQSYAWLNGFMNESKVLNIFRLWRLLRLFHSSVEEERSMHRRAIDEVDSIKLKARLTEVEASRLRLEVERERESKRAVEEMLQNYKEEVETLNEALKIAAQDIAEAAQEAEVVSEEGEEDAEERARGAERGRHDAASVSSKSNSSLNRYDHPPRRPVAFQINEDGSFEPK